MKRQEERRKEMRKLKREGRSRRREPSDREARLSRREQPVWETIFVLCGSFWLAAAGVFPAAAAPIKEVKIHLMAEEFDEAGKPILEAVSSSEKYEVCGFFETGKKLDTELEPVMGPWADQELGMGENRSDTGEPGDEIYEIELASGVPEGFAVMEEKDIRFTGVGGTCVKAVRKDAGQTLLLSVRPGSTGEIMGEISCVKMEGGRGCWTKAPNASAYLLMLFKDSKRLGLSYRTQGLEYDFSPLIKEPGIYYCKVYPLTESGKKGRGAESERKILRREEVEQIAGAFQAQRADTISEEGAPTWRRTEDGWYYTQADGTYPQENWLLIEGEWYYFDRDGRMKADCWQVWKGTQYFLGKSGLIEDEK